MSRDPGADTFRREMGANMPTGPYKVAEQSATVRDITPKKPHVIERHLLAGGVWMVYDGDVWRVATPDEIRQFGDDDQA